MELEERVQWNENSYSESLCGTFTQLIRCFHA